MENLLIINLFSQLRMYKAVENYFICCDVKGTHVDKKGLMLFTCGYAQIMLSFVRGCEQFMRAAG